MSRLFFLFFLFISTFTIAGYCKAATSQGNLIPREILFGNPEKTSPQLSPDGKKLAYLAPDQTNVLNVWVRDLQYLEKDELITSDKKRGIHSFCWTYDGKHLLYVQDLDGDENWHLYQTNIRTKSTRDLTPFEGARVGILAYEVAFPEEILLQLNVRNPALFDVYRMNLQTGSLSLEVENPGDVAEWLADHALHVRASKSYGKSGESIIRVRDESSWHELIRWGAEDEGELVTFSADGQFLYLLSNLNANTTRLLKINLSSRAKELIAEDSHYDLSTVMENPITHKIEAVGVTRERFEWIALDAKVKQDFAILRNKKKEMKILSRDQKDEQWVVLYSSDRKPAHFYLYDRTKKTSHFLFSSTPKLEGYPLSDMRPISFRTRDGMKLHGYLTLPTNKKSKSLPSVLFVHGGPWVRDNWGYNPLVQWLANRGYAVLQVNYRGSTGYGKKYLNAGNREWAGKMHLDLLDGKQWLIEKGYADPKKVAIFGGSYGGYAVLVGLTFTPEEFCCGVDLVGPSNLVTLLQTLPPYWNPAKTVFTVRLGDLDTEKEFLESRSPLFKADRISRPLLIAQGANDPRVKQAESDQIVEKMRKNNKEVEYLLFPDEGHGFKRPENKLTFCLAAEKFLHKHLGGDFEPPPAEIKP